MRVLTPCVFLVLSVVGFGCDAGAKEPSALFGAGTVTCESFVNTEAAHAKPYSNAVFSWVQGWFSARNVAGRGKPLTVGSTLSPTTLRSMLVDECKELVPERPVWLAADQLYDRLAEKGL
jgi:hypothetical protein